MLPRAVEDEGEGNELASSVLRCAQRVVGAALGLRAGEPAGSLPGSGFSGPLGLGEASGVHRLVLEEQRVPACLGASPSPARRWAGLKQPGGACGLLTPAPPSPHPGTARPTAAPGFPCPEALPLIGLSCSLLGAWSLTPRRRVVLGVTRTDSPAGVLMRSSLPFPVNRRRLQTVGVHVRAGC